MATEYAVDTVSTAVEGMMKSSQRVADLEAGGPNMRSKGELYLPKFPQETEEDYQARLHSTWLFNGVSKAIEDMAGKVFSKPVVLAVPDGNPLNELMSNVDLEGRDLSNFALDVFKAGVKRGISFIMVDAPKREGEVTVGVARELGLRPSMSFVPLESVVGWKWENINNKPQLTQFRIRETAEDPNRSEFSDDIVEQIRVLDLIDGRVRVRIYQGPSITGGVQASSVSGWELVEEYDTDMGEIMVTPFYTDRKGYLIAKSPLNDLAEGNMAHWRVQSDKASCLHKALAPLLMLKGMGIEAAETGELVMSAGYAFVSNSEIAQMEWVEITGAGIAAARIELKDLEFQMQAMGLQLMVAKTGNNTATGDAIDEGKENSRLGMWADNLKDAIEIALGWMADLAGISGADTNVRVNKEFTALSHLTMDQVRDMYNNSVISKHTYIQEARRRGVLDESVKAEDELDRVQEEGGEFVDRPEVQNDAI